MFTVVPPFIVPCIRRVSQLKNYRDDGEEEEEELLNFNAEELLGEGSGGADDDEWVATHTSSKGELDLCKLIWSIRVRRPVLIAGGM